MLCLCIAMGITTLSINSKLIILLYQPKKSKQRENCFKLINIDESKINLLVAEVSHEVAFSSSDLAISELSFAE